MVTEEWLLMSECKKRSHFRSCHICDHNFEVDHTNMLSLICGKCDKRQLERRARIQKWTALIYKVLALLILMYLSYAFLKWYTLDFKVVVP